MFDTKINNWSTYKNDTKKVKSNLQNEIDYFHYMYPTKGLYLEHTENSYKSTRETQLRREIGISLPQELDKKDIQTGTTSKRTNNSRKRKVEAPGGKRTDPRTAENKMTEHNECQ